jgi:dihydroorotate dehydrogenase electron transfer subunit
MSEIAFTKVIENKQIAPDIFDLRIHSPGQSAKAVAGQFLGIYTGNPSMLLPRPLSICEIDAKGGILRVVYRVVGGGTREIADFTADDKLRVLGPLGNGYEKALAAGDMKEMKNIAIVGGGLGVPPLLELAADIRKREPETKIAVYLGFRDKLQVILEGDFGKYADEITVCTDNGSYGLDGNVLANMPQDPQYDMIYGCGPAPMLRALARYAEQKNLPCFVSVEEHMACCVGTCLACAVKVRQNGNGSGIPVNKRACCDGPVFNAREVVWE